MTTPTHEDPAPEGNPFSPPAFTSAPQHVPQATTGGVPHGFGHGMPPAMAPRPAVRRVGTAAKAWIAVGIVLALGLGSLGAFGIAGLRLLSSDPTSGSCLYLSGAAGGSPAYHRVNCDDNLATYRVDSVKGAYGLCVGSDYVRFRMYDSRDRSTSSLCLALNVRTGDCLRNVDDETSIGKVGCGNPTAEMRATVYNGVNSASVCESPSRALVYGEPPERTVCLLPTGENI